MASSSKVASVLNYGEHAIGQNADKKSPEFLPMEKDRHERLTLDNVW
jgi:hypothetical protein